MGGKLRRNGPIRWTIPETQRAEKLSPAENFTASADKYRYYRANWVRNGGQELRGYVSGI